MIWMSVSHERRAKRQRVNDTVTRKERCRHARQNWTTTQNTRLEHCTALPCTVLPCTALRNSVAQHKTRALHTAHDTKAALGLSL